MFDDICKLVCYEWVKVFSIITKYRLEINRFYKFILKFYISFYDNFCSKDSIFIIIQNHSHYQNTSNH